MEELSLVVGKLGGNDEDKVDEPPDAAAAQRDKHQDAGSNLSYIEAVYAQFAEEYAQQQGDEPTVVGMLNRLRLEVFRIVVNHRLAHATLRADFSFCINHFAAIHTILFVFAFHCCHI